MTPPASESAHRLPPGFGVLWVTVALDLLGFGIVLPILPLWAEDLGASALTVGLLVASYSLAQFAFSPVWGRLSDQVGRRPVLLVALAGSAMGSLLTGLAGSVTLLFVGRLVDGASGASIGVAQAAVADAAEPSERTRLLGLLGAAFGVGLVGGPALGGLASVFDRRAPFLVAALIAAVNFGVASARLPETRPEPGDAPPVPWRSLVRGSVALLLTVSFSTIAAFAMFEATFSLLVEERFGLTAAGVGLLFAAIGVGLVLLQARGVGPVTHRLGEPRALRTALVVLAAGLVLIGAADTWTVLALALVLVVAGRGLVGPLLSSALAEAAPADRRGAVLGVQQGLGAMGRVVGPAVAGLLYSEVGVAVPYLAAGTVLGLVVAVLVPSA